MKAGKMAGINGDMLDTWIRKQRERAFMEQSLGNAGVRTAGEDLLDRIYREIAEEAAGLRDNGTYDYRLLARYRLRNMRWKAVSAARETDRRLQRFALYRTYVRRFLKVVCGRRSGGRKVNVFLLMTHRKETYVRLLYRRILNREPDAEGYSHNLKLLKEKKADKVGLLDAFCASSEAGVCTRLTCRRLAGIVYGRRK